MGDMAPSSTDGVSSAVVSISAKIMVTAVVVLFFVVVFCLFVSCYARWYSLNTEDPAIVSWRRRAARNRAPAAAATRRKGLDPAALQALPIVLYDPKDFKEQLECAVCLSEVSEGEKARLLPKCNHGFHVECIDMWFQSHSTCPLCRNPVISSQNSSSNSDDGNNDIELQGISENGNSSDSDSDSDDDRSSYASAVSSVRVPTNVLFWGNEVQVNSRGEATNAAASSSASTSTTRPKHGELVIEIPRELCEDCMSSPPSGTQFGQEEAKTPTVSRLRSLRRLLSRGKRVAPTTNGSSSGDVEPV